MEGLKGKTVIVTGGGGEIGAGICKRYGKEGSKVAIFDINPDSGNAVASEIEKAGGTAKAYAVDLTDYDAVSATVDAVRKDLGPIDILVNNAGWDQFNPFLKTTPDFWRKIIDINLITVLNMIHCVLPEMVERKTGRVVTISSDSGRVGSSGESVYSACKAGHMALSKTLAREHARDGVAFNVVCPGLTDTKLLHDFMAAAGNPEKLRTAYERATPMGRLGQPEEIAGATLFLTSDDSSFITGQVISVSGGLTMSS